jgi:hypothetical protein
MVGSETYYIYPLPCLPINLEFTFYMKHKSLSFCNLPAPILQVNTTIPGEAIPANLSHIAQAVYALIDSSASSPLLADALFLFQIRELIYLRLKDPRVSLRAS